MDQEYKLWADGTWSEIDEELTWMSDDFLIIDETTTIQALIAWVGNEQASTFLLEIGGL